MTPAEFIAKFGVQSFWHFTDTRNLGSIRTAGAILRLAEAQRRRIEIPAPGGNDWSQKADKRLGLDEYVHLCLVGEHPMEFRAKEQGHIVESVFLGVSVEVLSVPDVRFAPGVANRSGVPLLTLDQAVAQMDFEVVYTRMNWKDPAIKERLKVARKYELLVPRDLPLALVRGL